MNRRDFIRAAGVVAGSAATTGLARNGRPQRSVLPAPPRPNILVITTDQQSSDALSCRMGSTSLKTPAMDGLAAQGTFFSHSYAANPLCIPARTAMLTGRCPHVTGLQTNDNAASLDGKFATYGTLLRNAGYDTAYFGKWHVPFTRSKPDAHGFDVLGANRNDGVDAEIPALAEAFLKRPRARPFLLVTSFVNPHNICEWARGEELKNGPIGEPPAPDLCPPAVTNLADMRDAPDVIPLIRRSYQSNRLFPVGGFDESKWRQYRWAYFRMIEMVDAHIGKVLQALQETGQDANTLIVFTSDHGDCQGAHGWNQKTVLFDESVRVPLIVRPPGGASASVSDLLVNIGIDLLPTLCGYAGVEVPAGLPGMNLQRAVRGEIARGARPYVVVENKMVQGDPVGGEKPEPAGRLVRTRRFSYCAYDIGTRRESLVDLENDPGELVNLAGSASHRQVLHEHRMYLTDWCRTTGDPFEVPGSHLLREAEKALAAGPFSVMLKRRIPPSGDKHDFLSMAPYWWPDPAKPDGLPYIRRDGEVNPESRDGFDDHALDAMQEAARVMALAYRETGDERFASRAALLLRTWFLEPATRMNPHLEYGQFIPGRNEGRGAGIIVTRRMVWILEAARTIAGSPSWTSADRKGLEAWCSAYSAWLQTSRNGKEEAGARNNHGTWYEVQLVAMLLYTGRQAEARALLETRAKARLADQIEPDGRQPRELARTRSWSYSVMNLEGWFALARLGREAGVDLWHVRTTDGRSIRAALDYLVTFAANGSTWPHQQITPFDTGPLVPLLREAAVEWREGSYAALADRLGGGQK